ncbi:response regulator transcription factor [uncultured Hyphomonas sp.]|uniref:response regulator transcription factor n=1 Tax=uncultured Hyphomonas sp. TaxID=225298 RepID=UPI002AAA9460|nr:response regulator transcription factor [uncultured Hyphomonas sp.]
MKSILIVEDIAETRAWLREAAEAAFPGNEIREATNVREAVYAIKGHHFDIAIVDLGLPDGSGTDIISVLSVSRPETTVVVATVMGDDASVIAALSQGAQGYLLKDSPVDVFVRQLTLIEQGLPALSPSIARRIVEHFRKTAVAQENRSDLTPRERDVLGLIGRGLRNADTALALGLSESTVASHIKSIYAKLGISSRAEAALQAARLGLTQS